MLLLQVHDTIHHVVTNSTQAATTVDPLAWLKGLLAGVTVPFIIFVLNRYFSRRDKADDAAKAIEKEKAEAFKKLEAKVEDVVIKIQNAMRLIEDIGNETRRHEQDIRAANDRSVENKLRIEDLKSALARIEALMMKMIERVAKDT